MPLQKPPAHLQRTDSVTKMIGRAWSVAASTTAQNGDRKVTPRPRVGSKATGSPVLSASSDKSSSDRAAELSLRNRTPPSPFMGGNRLRVQSHAKRKSAIAKMRSVHTMASAVTKKSSRGRTSMQRILLGRSPQ